ncbi:30S ribosomal protein S1 [bacterium]|nr:30S ribosomal protein S1 [bacterium]
MNETIDPAMPELKVDLAALGITDSTYEEYTEEQLRTMVGKTIPTLEEDTIRKGRIVAIRAKDIVIDVGSKSEGVIPKEDFPDADQYAVGDEVEVLLIQKEDREGNIVLSKAQADQRRSWERCLKVVEGDGRVTGTITRKVKGGLMVDVLGIEAFLPSSQIALQNVRNVDDFLGQELEFKIIKVNHERKNLVVSRRELLDEERVKMKRAFLEKVRVGDVKRGSVKNITDFGAFIDLQGIDGLLHLTDMSWGRINHPSDILQLGQEIEVMIIGIDYDKERVSLGIKQMFDNPWHDVEAKYPVNTVVNGKVVNLLPYGAFIELEQGVEGLIHISELSWTRKVNHPSEYLQVGQQIRAMVLLVDPFEQKISLGLRQTMENPWETIEQRYPIGVKVRGKVRNITNYGAFVELEDGIDGLIHVSDMSWTRKVNHPSELLKKGDEIDAVVLNVNAEDHKIALGIKQLNEDPWEHIFDHYNEGDVVTGRITNTATFGAFILLREGIEGLIHISELDDHPVANVKDAVKVGDDVTGKIVRIDPTERKIAVSVREFKRDQVAVARVAEQGGEPVEPKVERKRFESGIDIEAALKGDKPEASEAPEAPDAPQQ